MTERRLLQPPEIIEVTEPTIFLAGPIQGAPDWQSEVAALIHDADPSIIVTSPRKEYAEGEFIYERQVDWETHFLRKAGESGVIGFWLAAQTVETPGRSYAQTTRFELAEWKMRHQRDGAKLVIGVEDNFGNARYIRRRFSQDAPDVPIVESKEELVATALRLLRQSYDDQETIGNKS